MKFTLEHLKEMYSNLSRSFAYEEAKQFMFDMYRMYNYGFINENDWKELEKYVEEFKVC